MPKRLSKRPKDVNQLMHHLGKLSTEEVAPKPEASKPPSRSEISRIMAAMGRKGGKKSAKLRMESMPPEQRSEIASRAARAMWAKKKAQQQN